MERLVEQFEKTDAGRREMAARTGALDRRRRALLIMVDGRTSAEDLLTRASQLGLDEETLFDLLRSGLIREVAEPDAGSAVQPPSEPEPHAAKAGVPLHKRSLAAARMYLMDMMVRTFGPKDHPARMQLIEETDQAAVKQAFETFLEILRGMATPSMVAHVEESFRNLLPIDDENLARGSVDAG